MAATTTAKKRLERGSVVPAAVRYLSPRPGHTPSLAPAPLGPMTGLGRLHGSDLRIGEREALS